LVVAAGTVSEPVGPPLPIASIAIWARPPYTMRLGTDSEEVVFEEWSTRIRDSVSQALAHVEGLSVPPPSVTTVVGKGATWQDAIEDVPWEDGEVLVVGSSELGPLAQVFLGSRATKILRHSPVPVAVVPRSRAKELASRAVHG
ncbi:MAG: universal stress protein, partial [Nocardioidaceae bacterium]|nr:universal stress protein [Nocardioidaceae bacterium]